VAAARISPLIYQRSRLTMLAISLLVLASGCGDGHAPGGGGVITLSGAIGAVKLDVSTEADVIAQLGAPEATADDNFHFPGAAEYKALGYGCTKTQARNAVELGYGRSTGPYCRTIYYINLARGVLGSFWTTSHAFHTARGTHPGVATGEAVRNERRPAANGCYIGLTETSRRLTLVLDVAGNSERPLHPGRNDHLARPVGGVVADFAVDSARSGVGLLFC
jgi:hypothetical protein